MVRHAWFNFDRLELLLIVAREQIVKRGGFAATLALRAIRMFVVVQRLVKDAVAWGMIAAVNPRPPHLVIDLDIQRGKIDLPVYETRLTRMNGKASIYKQGAAPYLITGDLNAGGMKRWRVERFHLCPYGW